jgi:hypothetical protein
MQQDPDITTIRLYVLVYPMGHELRAACMLWWIKMDGI